MVRTKNSRDCIRNTASLTPHQAQRATMLPEALEPPHEAVLLPPEFVHH